jgi:hypothetical protein
MHGSAKNCPWVRSISERSLVPGTSGILLMFMRYILPLTRITEYARGVSAIDKAGRENRHKSPSCSMTGHSFISLSGPQVVRIKEMKTSFLAASMSWSVCKKRE